HHSARGRRLWPSRPNTDLDPYRERTNPDGGATHRPTDRATTNPTTPDRSASRPDGRTGWPDPGANGRTELRRLAVTAGRWRSGRPARRRRGDRRLCSAQSTLADGGVRLLATERPASGRLLATERPASG